MRQKIEEFKKAAISNENFLRQERERFQQLGKSTFRSNRVQELEDRGLDLLDAMAMVDTVIEIIEGGR